MPSVTPAGDPPPKVWENDEFLAFLDIYPNTRGMTLVIPKQHYDSYVFEMPEPAYSRLMSAAREVVSLLERGLGVHRVALAMEGMGVDHAHLKLYPLHGLTAKFKETIADSQIFFDRYAGYISTQLGPRMGDDELRQLAAAIRQGARS
jgi:diadenosine tetraphosphate (Ap4A) HIT family hydrolase